MKRIYAAIIVVMFATLPLFVAVQAQQVNDTAGLAQAILEESAAPEATATPEAPQATAPAYEELTIGAKGDLVMALQNKLIALGYLTGTADGHYGRMTADAVKALEQYVRWLEQDEIDANAALAEAFGSVTQSESSATTEPDATPTPAATPVPTPSTKVDGVADPALLTLFMSDDFPSARVDLKLGDQGDHVTRFQRRLAVLGYLFGSPDGSYGPSTQRSVRLLQYYNGLEQDGIATVELQEMVFSGGAAAPDHPMLQKGSEGDEVTKLQKRLRSLGFMTGAVDGDYGAATIRGVENLQTYLKAQEREALTAEAMASGTPADEIKIDESKLETVVNGVADPMLLDKFYADDFPAIPGVLSKKAAGEDVKRVQRRLFALEYLFTSADGSYGGGTERAIKDFQKRNGLSQTGTADRGTLEKLFSDSAKKAIRPYVVKVSIAKQRVYVYGLDKNEEHTVLVKTMKASTGLNATPTPKGTYQSTTGPGARWHYFKKYFVWAQYAYYIQGDYMFHSVLFNQKGGKPTSSSVRNLGRKASHGCVRLKVEDAKWIWQNCPRGTTVVVY